jgi:putative transposase
MPVYHRHYTPGHDQFITTSVYRRVPLFRSERLARHFVDGFRELRIELEFALIGWVLMPDHFHVLLRSDPADATTLIVQQLKQRSAFRILRELKEHAEHVWCAKILVRLHLPETVHDHSTYRVWQRRFHPFNVYTEKKREEKINYMHNNPVKRGLVHHPGEWPWSSWRFYYRGDVSLLAMDRYAACLPQEPQASEGLRQPAWTERSRSDTTATAAGGDTRATMAVLGGQSDGRATCVAYI